jgi:hypothetical protein
MAQIINITSEALQATIRRLLPSQQGFGEDLQASNVIQPIIDLTPTAEGSILREDLQTAVTLTQASAFDVVATTTSIASTPGFYRITGAATIEPNSGDDRTVSIRITDGISTKKVWLARTKPNTNTSNSSYFLNFVFFLDTGETAQAASDSDCSVTGSVRQIADKQGNLVNPTGYTGE